MIFDISHLSNDQIHQIVSERNSVIKKMNVVRKYFFNRRLFHYEINNKQIQVSNIYYDGLKDVSATINILANEDGKRIMEVKYYMSKWPTLFGLAFSLLGLIVIFLMPGNILQGILIISGGITAIRLLFIQSQKFIKRDIVKLFELKSPLVIPNN
jgi:hypothetical protein